MSPAESAGMSPLTEREREVVRALVTHGRQRQAAEALGISLSTLKSHVASATRKMGRESSLQVAIAIDREDRQPGLDERRLQYALDVLDRVTAEQRPSGAQAARAWVVARAYGSAAAEGFVQPMPLARIDGDGAHHPHEAGDQEGFDGLGMAR